MIGRVISGNFKILELIGKGAAGKVFRAEQISLGKEVAVKVLHKHLLGDPSLVKRFHREAKASSRLSHPNCIQVIEFGQSRTGELFIAMEYIPGVNLGRVLHDSFPMTWARILRIMDQVCAALDEAHDKGIVHRDLKLENIMLIDRRNEKDLVKVLDFGIAKLISTEDGAQPTEATLTKAGNVCGTPEYMAPEQAQGGQLGPWTDIYALGIILFHLVTGQLPYQGETALVVATQHIIDPIPNAMQVRPDLNIPPALDALIAMCMAKNPAHRPASADELRGRLQQCLGQFAPQPRWTDTFQAINQNHQLSHPQQPYNTPSPIAARPVVIHHHSKPPSSPSFPARQPNQHSYVQVNTSPPKGPQPFDDAEEKTQLLVPAFTDDLNPIPSPPAVDPDRPRLRRDTMQAIQNISQSPAAPPSPKASPKQTPSQRPKQPRKPERFPLPIILALLAAAGFALVLLIVLALFLFVPI